jgi:hypothetical protein
VQKWIVTVLVRLRNMAIGALQGSGFIHLFVGRLLQGDGNPGVACQAFHPGNTVRVDNLQKINVQSIPDKCHSNIIER